MYNRSKPQVPLRLHVLEGQLHIRLKRSILPDTRGIDDRSTQKEIGLGHMLHFFVFFFLVEIFRGSGGVGHGITRNF